MKFHDNPLRDCCYVGCYGVSKWTRRRTTGIVLDIDVGPTPNGEFRNVARQPKVPVLPATIRDCIPSRGVHINESRTETRRPQYCTISLNSNCHSHWALRCTKFGRSSQVSSTIVEFRPRALQGVGARRADARPKPHPICRNPAPCHGSLGPLSKIETKISASRVTGPVELSEMVQ